MSLHGKSLVAGAPRSAGPSTFQAYNPLLGLPLEPSFEEAGAPLVEEALHAAQLALTGFRRSTPELRATFLETIAAEIIGLGDALLERAHQETGLPLERLSGERGRTVGQLRLFAELLREGSWCDARIDTALPERTPLPRPDLRRVLLPIGPVVVFGASNFPLAFSVAGGDTASALAAGCPVVVKGHPAHPGTGELVAGALASAVRLCGLPAGVFSFLQGSAHALGTALVQHPGVRAVGFTGSHRAGRALMDAAHSRPQPIPVFAEMSSLNPVFLLPGALHERTPQIAEGLKNSLTMGVGQFCTKPGLTFAISGSATESLKGALAAALKATSPGTLLHPGIRQSYADSVEAALNTKGVTLLAQADKEADPARTQARPSMCVTDALTFRSNPGLHSEVFGPAGLLVEATNFAEMLELAGGLEGQLTATIHAADSDLSQMEQLTRILEHKAGRVLLNGFPTGVEVSPAMQHGGPYPATSDSRFTSVGTAAILRWVRPVCYQNLPDNALPSELQNHNPLNVMRLVNGSLTRDPL
jgi:alpha-ketoglutaric semialdehyde dehydrogenase